MTTEVKYRVPCGVEVPGLVEVPGTFGAGVDRRARRRFRLQSEPGLRRSR